MNRFISVRLLTIAVAAIGVSALAAPRAAANEQPFEAQGTYLVTGGNGVTHFSGEISGSARPLGPFSGTFESVQHGHYRLLGTLVMKFNGVTLSVDYDLERPGKLGPWAGTYEIVVGAIGSGEAFLEPAGGGSGAFGLSGTIDR